MATDWDSENFDVPQHVPATALINKWDGEDEDDNVKDNWEDDEDDKKKEEQGPRKTITSQPKKTKSKLQEKIDERERREQQVRMGVLKEGRSDAEENKTMTPEEIHLEKLRRQKLVEDADLEVAKEMLGIAEESIHLDGLNPRTKEDFTLFQEALTKKILLYKKSEHFSNFAEELIRNICVNMQSPSLKKLKITIDSVFNEKVKAEKAKQKSKAKSRAQLKLDGSNNLFDEYSAYTVDEYDDFM